MEQHEDPRERVLAIVDWLERWFAQPDFRGCAWTNAYGELGSTSPAILAEVRGHKEAFHDQIAGWVQPCATLPADAVALLAEGAIVTAAITGDPTVARPPEPPPMPSSAVRVVTGTVRTWVGRLGLEPRTDGL